MAFVAECSACGKRFKADAKLAGRRSRCSACGVVFVIEPKPRPVATIAATITAAPAIAAEETKPVAEVSVAIAPPPPAGPAAAVIRTPVHVEVKPRPHHDVAPDLDLATGVEPVIVTDVHLAPPSAAAPRRRRHRRAIVAVVAALIVAGGATAVFAPRFLAPRSAGTVAKAEDRPDTAAVGDRPVAPAGAAAWSARPDPASRAPALPDDFHLTIPALAPLRHDPHSLVLSPAPGQFAALTLLPDPTDPPAGPTIEVWNITTRRRTATFQIGQPLSAPALSPDGTLYAGLISDAQIHNTRLEVWSATTTATTTTGTRARPVLSADLSSRSIGRAEAVLGFPSAHEVLVFGDKLVVADLAPRSAAPQLREIALPLRAGDLRAAASGQCRLVAVADAREVALIDLASGRSLGVAPIPPAAVAHPRQALTLRAMEFSPDGASLALLFENLQSTRRIACFDVATGALRSLETAALPVYAGGPVFQWTADSRGYLVGSGVLLDASSLRQVGQIYTDLPDEGLGGLLQAVLPADRALALWDKYPKGLVLRSIPVARDRAGWIAVNIVSATARRLEQLQCASREFGNELTSQSLSQSGRLTDGGQFLVVDARFTATPAADAPRMVPLRQDQFVLLADGRPRAPLGTINRDGNLTLERPAYDLRKADGAGAAPLPTRRRSIVFPVTGTERSLELRIAGARASIAMPADGGVQPPPALAPTPARHLADTLFNAPDDGAVVAVKVLSARVGPFDLDPPDAGDAPLRVTYSSPAPTEVLAVQFDMTVNMAATAPRGSDRRRIGLMLPDGTTLSPAVTLPGVLPNALVAGEHYTQTCLFVLATRASPLRLTFDATPVATVTPQRN